MACDDDAGTAEGELLCYSNIVNPEGEENRNDVHIMAASADPDTMMWHEAMREPDRAEFRAAAQKEWDDQHNNGNFVFVEKSNVPDNATLLPAVWAMRRKRDIRTRQVKKYKARLNVDGSKQIKGVHYDQTYAPVAR